MTLGDRPDGPPSQIASRFYFAVGSNAHGGRILKKFFIQAKRRERNLKQVWARQHSDSFASSRILVSWTGPSIDGGSSDLQHIPQPTDRGAARTSGGPPLKRQRDRDGWNTSSGKQDRRPWEGRSLDVKLQSSMIPWPPSMCDLEGTPGQE